MFLVVVAHPCSSPGQRAIKWLCVCVCVFLKKVLFIVAMVAKCRICLITETNAAHRFKSISF